MRENLGLTKQAADAATQSADTATKNARFTERALHITERGYLSIPACGAQFYGVDTPAPIAIEYEVINTGRTPGQITEVINKAVLLKTHHDLPTKPNYDGHPSVGFPLHIAPGGRETVILDQLPPVTLEMYNEMTEGKLLLFVWGRVIYADMFGKTHRIGFAYRGRLLQNSRFNIDIAPLPEYTYTTYET